MRPTMEVSAAAATATHGFVTCCLQDIIDDLNNMHNECTITGDACSLHHSRRTVLAHVSVADVPFTGIQQSQVQNQPSRALPVAAAALASPQKQSPSQNSPLPSHVNVDVVSVPTFSAAVAAAGRRSSERVAAHAPVDYYAVGPDGKRVACDWL
jgi:hypothetical protein